MRGTSEPVSAAAGFLAVAALSLCAGTPAWAQAPSWADPALVAAARAEGDTATVYTSVNEQEALPFWKIFEDATGIKVELSAPATWCCSAASPSRSARGQRSWDVAEPAVGPPAAQFPRSPFDLSEAKISIPQARDPDRRWYGVYANYDVPSYNTKLVKAVRPAEELRGFPHPQEWAGKIAIEQTDTQWLERAVHLLRRAACRKLIERHGTTLNPVPIDGHLALARAVAAGEYPMTLNNYLNLTVNMTLTGAADRLLGARSGRGVLRLGRRQRAGTASQDGGARGQFRAQQGSAAHADHGGRLPVRPDVTPNPPDAITRLGQHKIFVVDFPGDDEKKWQRTFQELFQHEMSRRRNSEVSQGEAWMKLVDLTRTGSAW